METLPWYPYFLLALAVATGLYLLHRASISSKTILLAVSALAAVETALSLAGFYQDTHAMPPRFALLVAPSLLLILACFATPGGRRLLDGLDPARLTLVHLLRIPVELMLWSLAVHGAIPVAMTFEGSNFDVVSGLTTPLVWYFGYVRKALPAWMLIGWNVVCLGLLANVVVTAALSVPGPLQHLNFNQPNQAVLYFPFTLLPGILVPLVLLAHLVCLRNLRSGSQAGRGRSITP